MRSLFIVVSDKRTFIFFSLLYSPYPPKLVKHLTLRNLISITEIVTRYLLAKIANSFWKIGQRSLVSNKAANSKNTSRGYSLQVRGWLFPNLNCKSVDILLDPPQRPQPITNAENETHCALYLARIDSLRKVFGDYIQRAVGNSLTQLHETANGHPPETTQSVWMKLPHQSMQDAIFHLNVGSAKELARVLFPHMSQNFASFLWPEASSSSITATAVMQPGEHSSSLTLGNLPDDG